MSGCYNCRYLQFDSVGDKMHYFCKYGLDVYLYERNEKEEAENTEYLHKHSCLARWAAH